MSDPDLERKAYLIVNAMNGNANFVTPIPAVNVIMQLADEFHDALNDSGEGDRVKIAIKNQKREALIDGLHQWAYYVLLTANGDDAVAQSSGFSLAKTYTPSPPLTKPEAPVLVSGINPGELVCKGKSIPGAVTYLHQYGTEAMVAADNWQSNPCSKAVCTLTNLQPGTKYFCRIVAVGRKEQLAYSDIVFRVAA